MVETFPTSCTALLSTTVSIANLEDDREVSLEKLVEDLSRLGDLARVDASLAGTLRRVLVTYFDVRSAQQALCEYGGQAEPFAPMAHDCRVVSITQAAFVEKVSSGCNLRSFGEVANVSIFLGHVTIEFYDMRAAQKLLLAAHGSAVPVPMDVLREMFPPRQSHQPQEAPQEHSQVPQGTPQQLLQQLLQQALSSQQRATPARSMPLAATRDEALGLSLGLSLGALAGLGLAAPTLPADLPLAGTPPAPGLTPVGPLAGPTAALGLTSAATSLFPSDPAVVAASGPAGQGSGMDSPGGRRGSRGGRSRATGAVHTKVAVWDFAKFDIDPDKIRRGQDPRTTVMVRNLTGVGSRKTFVSYLDHNGLGDKFTFVHMPCKEHRRVLAGFAFMNMCAPEDVLKLFLNLKKGGLNEFLGDQSSKTPSVSYARFQGQDELVKLFSTTAVLHEQDPERRPLFRKQAGRAASNTNAVVGSTSGSATNKKADMNGAPQCPYTHGNMNLALGG